MEKNRAAMKMLKSIWRILQKDIYYVLAVSIVYSLLFNLSLFRLVYSNNTIAEFLFYFAGSCVLVYLLFLILSLNRIVFSSALPVLFYISSVASFFVVKMKVTINQNTIGALFETDYGEASGLIGKEMILWVLLHLIAAALFDYIYLKKIKRDSYKIKLCINGILILCIFPLRSIKLFMPYSFATQTYKYFKEIKELNGLVKSRKGIPENAYKLIGSKLTVVFILGEAVRPDHFHINGYNRQTSPSLERWKAVSVPDVMSCETITRHSVPCIFTRNNGIDFEMQKMGYSFISVFRSLGFLTIWLSNQGYLGSNDNPVSAIAKESEIFRYFNKRGNVHGQLMFYDEILVSHLKSYLQYPNENKLIILHLIGSHWRYENHYPERYRIFQPVCQSSDPESCSAETLVNSYDNTLLYTDSIIGDVIESVKDLNSLVFFVSDHGESLGENGIFLHSGGQGSREQHLSAMFIWASDKYKKNNYSRFSNLINNRNRHLNHNIVFHSLLDGANIRSDLIDKNLSIFSNARENSK